MYYNQYPYNIFNQGMLANYSYISVEQQRALQHEVEQEENILKMRKAIADYCDAAKKVTPDYHEFAMWSCLEEIVGQMMKG